MSSHENHRRGEKERQDHGPTWEGGPPCSGSNSTHVAKSRAKWGKRRNRSFRRNGKVTSKFWPMQEGAIIQPVPVDKEDGL